MMRMNERRPAKHIPSRREAYEKAVFSALAAAVVALLVLKMLLGLAFAAAGVVAVVAFILFFGMALRMTPRREE
jgi:hypothetical protein